MILPRPVASQGRQQTTGKRRRKTGKTTAGLNIYTAWSEAAISDTDDRSLMPLSAVAGHVTTTAGLLCLLPT